MVQSRAKGGCPPYLHACPPTIIPRFLRRLQELLCQKSSFSLPLINACPPKVDYSGPQVLLDCLQCVLTRSDVFTGPPNLQFLLVFDQTLCQNLTKVLNLTGCMLFSVSFRFIITFEPVRYRNAKQCICLEFAQRFYQNDVLT